MKDLDADAARLADSSMADDWSYLCRRLAADLIAGPDQALADLDALRRTVMTRTNARMFVVGASSTQAALSGGIAALVGELAPGVAWQKLAPTAPIVAVAPGGSRSGSARARRTSGSSTRTRRAASSSIRHRSPGTPTPTRGKLLDFLSTNLTEDAAPTVSS